MAVAYRRFAGESEVARAAVRLVPRVLDSNEVDPFVIKYSDIILQPTYPSVNNKIIINNNKNNNNLSYLILFFDHIWYISRCVFIGF